MLISRGSKLVMLIGIKPNAPPATRRGSSRLPEMGDDRGSLPFEQNGPKEDIDDLRVVVRICPL